MNITALRGANFSGRTRRLRAWAGLDAHDPGLKRGAYIGPDCVSAISGIAHTVEGEIDLMALDDGSAAFGKKLLERLGFGYCLERNPFTLSGGEQVVVAVVAAMAGRPDRLAIDCALEQLSGDVRDRLLQVLGDVDGEVFIADNRLADWHSGAVEETVQAPDAPRAAPDAILEFHAAPTRIELIDLSFSYDKKRPIFSDLNVCIEEGKRYWLRGPNGAGKTTLSKILCGLLKPASGEIRVNGRRVEPWRTPGRYVAYHFQNPDYQLFANCVTESFRPAKQEDISALSRYFGLDSVLNAHPLDLPYVLRKRIAIAAAFSRNVTQAILDEPTLGQDDSFVAALTTRRFKPPYIAISHSLCFDDLPSITLPRSHSW